jgi:enoyl-CoA hydratase/carnithine racemase
VAARIILSGEPIDTAAALRWGLVDRVAPRAEFASAVEAGIARLLQEDPERVTRRRRAIVEGLVLAGEPSR